jgi:hypothetical protein
MNIPAPFILIIILLDKDFKYGDGAMFEAMLVKS